MSTTPSLAEVIKAGIDRKLEQLRVATPARIERVDLERQLVDVQPLLKEDQVDDEGVKTSVPLPVIPNVPVVFLGGGGFRTTYPVSKGDTCLLLHMDRSIDRWKVNGGLVDPGEDWRHELGDAVALCGLNDVAHAWTGASATNMTIGKDGGAKITITPTEIHLGGSSDFVALAAPITANLQAIKDTINAWVPVIPDDGGASLKAALMALFATWPASVASTNVKGE
jgi:hypothetical protein